MARYKCSPIGVFDSGVGGLSVLNQLKQHLPNESFIYLADSGYTPYGQQSKEILTARCQAIADFFIQQQVKMIVIACNTATAVMAEWLRDTLDLPIIGLEPAIKPACQVTKSRAIGVFATQNTLNSRRYQQLLAQYATTIKVLQSPCLGFVEQVENGDLNSLKTHRLIKKNLVPMLEESIDILVLGCTHYPFLLPAIQQVSRQFSNKPLTIIDTAKAVSKQAKVVLQAHHLLNDSQLPASVYFSTGNVREQQLIFRQLLNKNIILEKPQ